MKDVAERKYSDVEGFFRCLLTSSKSADARIMLGLIFFLNGQLCSAREQLQIAVDQHENEQIDPTVATVLLEHVQQLEKPYRVGNVIFLSRMSFKNF